MTPSSVIFLTARSDEVDRIVGLELGADDYVTKPFSPRELAARVKVVLRRFNSSKAGTAEEVVKRAGEFELNEAAKTISWRGEALKLSPHEYTLFATLLRHPGRVYSRRQLLEAAWEEPDASTERTVDTHVKTIRAKLKDVCGDLEVIVTHRGFGYALRKM